MKYALSVALMLLAVGIADSSRILGVFTAPSLSHQLVYRQLMLELQSRGHNLTIVTPDPIGDNGLKNYREIDVHQLHDYFKAKFDIAADKNRLLRLVPEIFLLAMFGPLGDFCDIVLTNKEVAALQNETFDLMFVEWGFTPCVYPLYLRADKNMIGILSLTMGWVSHMKVGSTSNPSYTPELYFSFTDHMSFWERVRNSLFYLAAYIYVQASLTAQDPIARKYFGETTDSLHDIQKDVSVIMTNTDPVTFYPRPMATNIVSIGGSPPFHLTGKQGKSLPKDLQEFLDSAEDGVIYFSLGSNVKSSTMPESKRAIFLNAFRQIKQKVLWKWETDDLPGKPDNVKVQKWLPQTDVLAHPKIRAFITQGGLQSMGEATHFTVPMVVIPFFADQELNAKKLESVGVSITLDFEKLTEEDVLRAITDIIKDPKYKESMVKYSELTKDQPMSPMERAVWWTEYVIRHKGARHLRSAAADLPWYQYFLLDVLAFLAAVLGVVLYILHFTFSRLFRLLLRRNKTKTE